MAWSYLVAGNWADGYECSEHAAYMEGRRVRQTNMDGRRVGQILMVTEWYRYGWSEGGADIDGQRVEQIWMVGGWGRY
jgi:hypothetical protein